LRGLDHLQHSTTPVLGLHLVGLALTLCRIWMTRVPWSVSSGSFSCLLPSSHGAIQALVPIPAVPTSTPRRATPAHCYPGSLPPACPQSSTNSLFQDLVYSSRGPSWAVLGALRVESLALVNSTQFPDHFLPTAGMAPQAVAPLAAPGLPRLVDWPLRPIRAARRAPLRLLAPPRFTLVAILAYQCCQLPTPLHYS